MSGICGFIYKDPDRRVAKDLILEMSSSLCSQNKRQVYGHIENSRGMGAVNPEQFFTENGSIRVACDAELYNIKELVDLLKSKGYELQSQTESEVIARLYEEYNFKCVDKMRGIFAFALWDPKKKLLLLAIDRFGIKRLSYFNDPEKFIFASKIKAILQSKVSRDLNHQSLLQYLNFTAVPTPDSIFKNIYKLPPGHLLVLREGEVTIQQYWDMEYPESHERDEHLYATRVRDQISETVETHLRYQPPENIGAFLSGGTDSSTVVGMLTKISGKKVRTFSIGFEEEGYNEIQYARITAKHFNTEHYEYFVTPQDVLSAIPLLVKEYDEPFGNASAIPTYYCAKLAKDHKVNILFAGDGGDELFAGNKRYSADKIFSLYEEIPSTLRKRVIEPIFFTVPSWIPLVTKGRKYIRRSNIPHPKRFFSYHYLVSSRLEDIFTRDFLNTVSEETLLEIPEKYYAQVKASSDLNRLLYIDLKLAITDNDLLKVNRMAEVAGISVRYPLLDYLLAEFSGTIPTPLKLKGFQLRYLFKKALKDFLPEEVIKKKKHGFGLPIGVWLKTDKQLHELARSTLLSSNLVQRGYIRKEALEDLFIKQQQGAYYGDNIWTFLMLELWYKEYLD
jgi:asparagine synthase (glutamine-hydrolysing)